ncbi:MAG TPA: hypothetical protein VK145_03185 [Candidatus Nanoarchaeia archaeon]|nr:hypothetical protein [Candidatus Nanoarchaeia archaeon]
MSAVEHVLENTMDFVEVASSAVSLASGLPHHDGGDVMEVSHEPHGELQPEPPEAEEASSLIHVRDGEPSTAPTTTIALVSGPSASDFFAEEDDADPSQFRDENGRPFGSLMSLPSVIAVGDQVDLNQVVSSVITSLDNNSRDLEEMTPLLTTMTPILPVVHVEHVDSGAVVFPLPSFHEVISTVPGNQQPSVNNFEDAFGEFLMKTNDGGPNDVRIGDFEGQVIDDVLMEEVVDEEVVDEEVVDEEVVDEEVVDEEFVDEEGPTGPESFHAEEA